MRDLTRSFLLTVSTAGLAAVIATACSDVPTGVPDGATFAAARVGTAPYTVLDLGVLAGDNTSRVNGVNDAGIAVGYSANFTSFRPFAMLGGVMTALPGGEGQAFAISDGGAPHVVGSLDGRPVRWLLTAGAAGNPEYLNTGTGTFGAARGVNDAGAAVGNVGNGAALWDAAGNLALVETPQGFTRGEGRGINNDGLAVFVFRHNAAGWEGGMAVGYLRLASGALVPLPPVGNDVVSYVNGLNAVAANTVQIAGSTYADPETSRAVRWTVNATTGEILATDIRPERSHALAVSDEGDFAGFVEGRPNSLKSTAFIVTGNSLLSLKVPKKARDGKAWAMSASGDFIGGEAIVQLSRRAVLWSAPSQ